MANINKLLVLLTTFLFTHSASAVIVEGSFSGIFWDTWHTNTELSPVAEFWSVETNWTEGFEGTFWYDTALAGAPVFEGDDYYENTTYTGTHNWLHGTLTVKGKKIALTKGGQVDPDRPERLDQILFSQNINEFNELEQTFWFSYGDDMYADPSGRGGGFGISPHAQPFPFLNDFSLTPNFSMPGYQSDWGSYLGYMQFAEWGEVDGVKYEGFLSGEINKFDIHVRVPEPASLLLFLCVLPLLIWRLRVVQPAFSKAVSQ